jgi:hypothetical protein
MIKYVFFIEKGQLVYQGKDSSYIRGTDDDVSFVLHADLHAYFSFHSAS